MIDRIIDFVQDNRFGVSLVLACVIPVLLLSSFILCLGEVLGLERGEAVQVDTLEGGIIDVAPSPDRQFQRYMDRELGVVCYGLTGAGMGSGAALECTTLNGDQANPFGR